MSPAALDVLLLSDFTCELFAGYLQNGEELPAVAVRTSGFGQVLSVLTAEEETPAEQRPDVTIVWTRPEAVVPSFARLMQFEDVAIDDIVAEVDAYAAAIKRFASRSKLVMVPTWVTRPQRPYGLMEMKPGRGIAHAVQRMNLALSEALDVPGVHVLNADRWMFAAGGEAFSTKRWYMGKVPFSNAVFREAARDIKAGLRGIFGQGRKLVVLDLDDTLWGGIVGDDGWENLQLGGHDATGEALVDFQHALKALTRRGILLGIVSKNTESVALEAIEQHPEMVLELHDFAGWKINWQDKARNLAELAAELNLGLQSVVFIDDNPVERARVREALPEVLVPEWPVDKTQYPVALHSLDCFESARISEEDRARAAMYATERQRQTLKTSVGSVDEWLMSLGTKIAVQRLGEGNIKRTVQLLNKTNQLNLRTRRMTESDLASWAAQANARTWVFSVEDRFGAAGLTGIVSVSHDGTTAKLDDFVLSCRVMGRRVEEAMLHVAARYARDVGAKKIVAAYAPTAKNKPCLEFFQRSGWTADSNGEEFVWDLRSEYPAPKSVTIEEA